MDTLRMPLSTKGKHCICLLHLMLSVCLHAYIHIEYLMQQNPYYTRLSSHAICLYFKVLQLLYNWTRYQILHEGNEKWHLEEIVYNVFFYLLHRNLTFLLLILLAYAYIKMVPSPTAQNFCRNFTIFIPVCIYMYRCVYVSVIKMWWLIYQ